MVPSTRPFSTSASLFFPHSTPKFHNLFSSTAAFRMGTKPFSSQNPSHLPSETNRIPAAEAAVSLQEWQGWGTVSPVPSMVTQVIRDLKLLEKTLDARMTFDGNHGTLSGEFKVHEDKKHRAKYKSLGSSEEKIQFFSARQIACRLLGSRVLASTRRLHVLKHCKDFLRQNNTGKLLWQVFGIQAATLCLFGIIEHEEMMWEVLKHAGRHRVCCLYPNKNAMTKSVEESFKFTIDHETQAATKSNSMHFILIDGTWSNSGAMFRRLQDRAKLVWGDELQCVSLNSGASAMHKLRPQPSWDRTCTAAAAASLLDELQLLPDFSSCGLDKQATAVENALEVLLEALTARRLRMGRSISRRERHNRDIC
ncbi:uncharacterized protein LOC127263098 isoform X2 [Andrographis paniculata]|uniref:uncharacterized protein LOC127263098 isoform X2 n=1 Tax=Andrographis paniculata TaxID=175694 RepID=UPI0021E75D91|nr:uncharacterized protein LOC127263098 isoform X2 [Andrographis paniculata]